MKECCCFNLFWIAKILLSATTTTTSLSVFATGLKVEYDVTISFDRLANGQTLGIRLGSGLKVIGFESDEFDRLPWIAQEGGVRSGDKIIAFDGIPCTSYSIKAFQAEVAEAVESVRTKGKGVTLRMLSNSIDNGVREYQRLKGSLSTAHENTALPAKADHWHHLDVIVGGLLIASLNVTRAAFGNDPPSCDSKPLVWVMPYPNDACGKIENCMNLKGSHALVGRGGGCTFEAKAHAVVQCGAASLIVVDSGEGWIQMNPERWPGPSIPSCMISDKSRQILDNIFKQNPTRKDRLEGHLVVTRECLKEELNWHEPHHSQLTQQQQSSEHHSRDLKIQTEIEEEEKAEEEGLSKIENKSDIRRFTNKLQTRIRDANLTEEIQNSTCAPSGHFVFSIPSSSNVNGVDIKPTAVVAEYVLVTPNGLNSSSHHEEFKKSLYINELPVHTMPGLEYLTGCCHDMSGSCKRDLLEEHLAIILPTAYNAGGGCKDVYSAINTAFHAGALAVVIVSAPRESILAALSHEDIIRAAHHFSLSAFVVSLGDIQQLLEDNELLQSNSWDGGVHQDDGGTNVEMKSSLCVVSCYTDPTVIKLWGEVEWLKDERNWAAIRRQIKRVKRVLREVHNPFSKSGTGSHPRWHAVELVMMQILGQQDGYPNQVLTTTVEEL